MEEGFYYCQACDAKVTLDQLALLNGGKCPACGLLAGFSTVPKSGQDGFEQLTMINDADLLKSLLSNTEFPE